jgi:hypothetical protein
LAVLAMALLLPLAASAQYGSDKSSDKDSSKSSSSSSNSSKLCKADQDFLIKAAQGGAAGKAN